jgi:hypothetical protein
MAAVDFAEFALEEFPNNEQTALSAVTPNRKSTNLMYPPSRTVRVSAAPTPMSRADELRGLKGEVPRLADTYEPAGVLTVRAYGDILPFLLALSGFDGVATAGGALVSDGYSSTVSGANGLNSTTILVVSTAGADPSGTIIVNGVAVTYTGITGNTFTGCGAHAALVGGETVTGNTPTGATKWVFDKRGGINAQTARVRTNYADENVELQAYGVGVSSLGINAGAELSADLMALYMRRLAADTTTVPVISAGAIQPFRRGDLFISALAGGGVLSDWSLTIANSLERIRTASLSPPSDWPDLMELGDDQVQVSGTLPKRVLTGADYDALIAATTFAMLARWTGRSTIAATGKRYGLWINMPKVQYVGGEQDELQNRRRHGFAPDWFASVDEALGYDCRITVVCGVPAIATYV